MPLTVGTAGHIDHGKTWLVRALTGKDTDRLPEEQARGISIDLGYAPLELPDGRRLSLVDVPGHERFVRTMVAGASGIDLFLLVIDAGEGARPQTHEHLAILRLLGVERGVVAVTKADAVDAETLGLALAEAHELLPDAEAVAVSAKSGEGLDELRAALAPLIPAQAVFDGWSETALAAAARELGVPADRAALCFPGGAVEMIDAWFAAIDADLARTFPRERIATMKIRDRIRELVWHRITAASVHADALRRALAILARPANAARAAKLGWRAADTMWRIAGDTSTDAAHYTKRATLSAVYAATMLAWMDDESEDFADTRAFLDRRIDNVMQFEKWKARIKPGGDRHFSPARFLGRLRYPVAR